MLSESRRTLHDAPSSPLGTGLSSCVLSFRSIHAAHALCSTPPHRAEHKRRQRAVSSTPHNLDFFDSRVDNAPPVSARQPFPPTITTAFDRERVPTMPATTPVQPSGKADSSMTPAEKARERSLREDPLANVLDPSHVECRRCNKKIKLSSKSAFDTFHWRNHRARCMRTAKKKGPGGRAPKVRSLDLGRPVCFPASFPFLPCADGQLRSASRRPHCLSIQTAMGGAHCARRRSCRTAMTGVRRRIVRALRTRRLSHRRSIRPSVAPAHSAVPSILMERRLTHTKDPTRLRRFDRGITGAWTSTSVASIPRLLGPSRRSQAITGKAGRGHS